MSGRLTASFTRRRGERDQVQVLRTDGTKTEWEFPGYGDALPHDLVHFIVEKGLGLTDGFWGLIDDGADVVMVNDQAVLSRDGKPLREPAVDFSGLIKAEEAVALLGPKPVLEAVGRLTVARLDPESFSPPASDETVSHLGFRMPDNATSDTVAAIQGRLRELTQHWRQLNNESITLAWCRGESQPTTHGE
jgi:hypothetical protein